MKVYSDCRVATDLEFYSRSEQADPAEDLDFLEHIEYTTRLRANKNVMLRRGYDVFYSLPVYQNEVEMPPALVISVGLFLNTNSDETSWHQSAIFGHSMGAFHAAAMDAALQQYPSALVCFVSCSRIASIEINANHTQLLRLPVLSHKGSHLITNVRYGETDPQKRSLESDFTGILGGNIQAATPHITKDNRLDVWTLVASASRVGPVLFMAGNRFQAACSLIDFCDCAARVPPFQQSQVPAGDVHESRSIHCVCV